MVTSRKKLQGIHRVLAALEGAGKTLIVSHNNPDPDSLVSSIGLQRIFNRQLSGEFSLGYSGIIGRSENKALLKYSGGKFVPLDQLDLSSFDAMVMVDTQPGAHNHSIPSDAPVRVVLDHHPRKKGNSESVEYADIRVRYGATATMVFEFFEDLNLPISRKMATLFYYAIQSETRNLGRDVCERDRLAFMKLFPIVDHQSLSRIENAQVNASYFLYFHRALEEAYIYGDVLFTFIGEVEDPDIIAEIADYFLRYEAINWSVCLGRYDGTLYASLRSNDKRARAGEVAITIADGIGVAGGHGMTAGAQIALPEGDSGNGGTAETVEDVRHRVLKTLKVSRRKRRKLLEIS
jgi:nanoRNase/pAp phosphatase (c-di-AMP/oligoRNAs hydrolase)